MQDGERVRHAPIIGDDEIAIDLDRDQHDRERDRDDDEKIADLEHGLLRMAHRSGAGDEARRAAEESVGARRRDDADHLALLDDAAGKSGVADLLGHGQGFAGQRRLVDRGVIAGNEPQIGGHDDAEPYFHDVAGHERGRGLGAPLAVAQQCGLWREAFLQRGERAGGLAILPEFEPGVEQQQSEYDREIIPMADQRGDDRRRFDHIGHGPGEIAERLSATC